MILYFLSGNGMVLSLKAKALLEVDITIVFSKTSVSTYEMFFHTAPPRLMWIKLPASMRVRYPDHIGYSGF